MQFNIMEVLFPYSLSHSLSGFQGQLAGIHDFRANSPRREATTMRQTVLAAV